MPRTQPSKGRIAIDLIKAAYQQGMVFLNASAIRDYLIAQEPDVLGNCSARTATDWDRQARYELYRLDKFVTHPVGQYEYERTPSAAVDKRRRTRTTRLRELQTRTRNETLAAHAAAAQFDATQIERDQVSELEMMTYLIDRVMEKSGL